MKRTGRFLAILLCLVMVLSISAFASWNVYGGNDNHNAKLTSGAPTVATGSSTTAINLTPNLSGWSGVENVPVMQKIGSTTFAYILFDGRSTNGAQVTKYNCNTRTQEWRTTAYGTVGTSLNAKSGFQLSTPYLDNNGTASDESDDVLYVGVLSQYDDYVGGEWLTGTGSKLMMISNLDADGINDMPVVDTLITGITGQINTPIVKYGDYVYFGTWTSNNGSGTYYQVDVSDSNVTTSDIKTFPASYGFYWAGAVSDGSNIYFGSDNGMLYWRKIGSNFGTNGGSLDLKDTTNVTNAASNAGNVRSTVVLGDDGYLYFTSQGGYLWCCTFDSFSEELSISWKAALTGASTSTPTIVGDRIYVGAYGVNGKGIRCINTSTHDVTSKLTTLPIQSSIVVMRSGNLDYLYFTVNAANDNVSESGGGGYCYSFSNTSTAGTPSLEWECQSTFSLAGMAIDSGVAVFGNDANGLFIVQ